MCDCVCMCAYTCARLGCSIIVVRTVDSIERTGTDHLAAVSKLGQFFFTPHCLIYTAGLSGGVKH